MAAYRRTFLQPTLPIRAKDWFGRPRHRVSGAQSMVIVWDAATLPDHSLISVLPVRHSWTFESTALQVYAVRGDCRYQP